MGGDLAGQLSDLREEEVLDTVRGRLEKGDDPLKIMEDARRGMELVGKRFEKGEYFIPDLVYAGEILKELTAIVKPELARAAGTSYMGKFVLGTVAGDIHDIGKDIVAFMMDVSGFEVHDLGVDVPPRKFVDKIKETGARIVGLSGFLTLAFDSMKETVEAIEAAGLRDKVKIMVGGGLIDEEVRRYTGADAYGRDAVAAVSIGKKWVGGE
ncbi:MAG: cobalamin B12-binding domain-containing protein [Dehalococcoidia bacterium]|nr:cobalamin B12-binding domain-containing protein [Dehalococcoidia bacterium]